MAPQMALIRGNGGQDDRFYVRDPKKAHPWAERRVLAYFASKSIQGPRLYRVARTQKNNQKTKTFNVQSHACAETKPRIGIMTNFCIGVGVHDVITSANFYDYRLRRLGVVGGGF